MLHHQIKHTTTCKGGYDIPTSVLQEEVKSHQAQIGVLSTLKEAILCGDPECDNLLAVSVYETKPLHFFTTTSMSLKWVEKEQLV